MRKRSGSEVVRITGARRGLAEDVRGRQRRYVISMSVRTVAVILAATLWNVERYVAVVALVLGALLPYVAVVIANAGRENGPPLPAAFIPTPVRPMLLSGHQESPSRPGPQTRHERPAHPGWQDPPEWRARPAPAGQDPTPQERQGRGADSEPPSDAAGGPASDAAGPDTAGPDTAAGPEADPGTWPASDAAPRPAAGTASAAASDAAPRPEEGPEQGAESSRGESSGDPGHADGAAPGDPL